MKPDVSSKRQNELVTEVASLVQSHQQTVRQLQQTFDSDVAETNRQGAARRQELNRTLLLRQDELESEYERQRVATAEEFDAQMQVVRSERDENLNSAKKWEKSARSDGEYDWFLAKQRLQKEFETDRLEVKEGYKKRKANLKQHGDKYNGLATHAKAVLGKHRCPLKVHGGDLLEPPAEGDHLGAHQQTYSQVEELIRQFRRSFWVKFQEERWYLIAFLVAIVIAAYPIHLALANVVTTGVATAATGVLAAFAAWLVSRAMAQKTAFQFRESFVTAIAAGKEQLLAAQHQNKQRRESQLRLLATQHAQALEELDTNWGALQTDIQGRLDRRIKELTTLAERRAAVIDQAREARKQSLAAEYEPRLRALASEREQKNQELQRIEAEQYADRRSQLKTEQKKLADSWHARVDQIEKETASMEAAVSQMFDYKAAPSAWKLADRPPAAVSFGRLRAEVAGFPDELKLPASLDLLHAPSLLVEQQAGGGPNANRVLRAAMMRLLTSIPPGKTRFTIVDPVGLGQDFSAFMHLGDYDEQLINHRIWTEGAHINARLQDLTQHMENVIQTYLRNEFETIQEYNEHAGEVAEAFRVLVVANFPAGFTEEAARRLMSIVTSGPRCGVYTLISFDPLGSLPRNFDLEALKEYTNHMIAGPAEIRWANPPISQFPIELDVLPEDERCSQIMHLIGERAKDANRVEVPFAAVAPREDLWWKGDSRSEVNVPLGRAGATKMQSIQLGHGTSQHVLISGKTGSGKSTLLHATITNLALKYSPQEVQFYLIDFKKGVEFKAYAEHHLPHARVIAIESEREFGLSVLQRLDLELRRRGDLFRRVGVQSLAGYRDARPDERMPRVLLIIDEFQEFFVKEDKIAQEASLLLDRLVRQGRAFGIHVLLGSQTLAGAYSLARATIGQMAVRIALQCSASDAHLILSDDNDAARMLRRPGEAIYNDANGLVEGNHPFQVVWLSDVEKEQYLRQLAVKQGEAAQTVEPPIVFEGNVAADVARNELLHKAWSAPAPDDVPLAPRAWLGEAIAIKEPPANVFHRRSGSNLLLVGQQEEAAMGVMASALLSVAAFSPHGEQRSRLIILDGTRPEANEAGYWNRLQEMSGLTCSVVKPRDAAQTIAELCQDATDSDMDDDRERAATFLFIYNLSRFRELQKSEDDFGFGSFGEQTRSSSAEQLATVLREGPARGIHTILWSDTHTNLMRWIDRQSLRDMEARVLFQMSSTDSSNLMDSSAAAQLGQHRAIFYSEDQGRAERFRPYGLPSDDFLLKIRSLESAVNRVHKSPRNS